MAVRTHAHTTIFARGRPLLLMQPIDLAALEVANDASQKVYFAHALAECEYCKRRFKKPALRKHRRACTAARPFAPPIARRPKDRGAAPAAWL